MKSEKFSNINNDVIFGNTFEFACQIKVDDNMYGKWMVGRICFWLFDEMIGDYEYRVSLRDTMLAMEQVIAERGRRRHDYFFYVSTSEFYNRVHCSMFGDSPNHNDVLQMYEEEWGRLLVDIPISAYCNKIIYLIEGMDNDRLIIIGSDLSKSKDVRLPIGLFYDIINQAYTYLAKVFFCQ